MNRRMRGWVNGKRESERTKREGAREERRKGRKEVVWTDRERTSLYLLIIFHHKRNYKI